jgi:dipeptidase E
MSTEERRDAWRRGLDAFLGPVRRLLFVPYAITNHDLYLQRVVERDMAAGRAVEGIHRAADPREAVARADAIFVGGGNTFLLLKSLQDLGLLAPIAARIRAGAPYVGASAGTNVACPTIRTTNDMPVVSPAGLDALGLVPFQVNPHYFPGRAFLETPQGFVPYAGETRDDRLREFHEHNDTPVLAPWEGGVLRVEASRLTIDLAPARLFLRGEEPRDLAVGADASFLLAAAARGPRA